MPAFNVNDYVYTQSRINTFWEQCKEDGKQGFIHTELLTDADNDSFVAVKASVGWIVTGMQLVIATGIASEVRAYSAERNQPGHNRVNETSWVENCETSAIGRAFANLGYATTGADRPSREEMEKVAQYEAATESQSQAAQPASAQPQRQSGTYRPAQGKPSPQVQNPDANPTDRQLDTIRKMSKGTEDQIAFAMFEKPFTEITRGEASDMIKELFDARDRASNKGQEVIVEVDHKF